MEKTAELIKLSASSVKSYDQCPRKYFYNYIQKAPKKQWAHFDLGNLCHKALELFHLEYMNFGLKKSKTLGKMMGKAFKEARKEFPNMNDEMLVDAKSMLMEYLDAVKASGMPLVKGVETSFSFNITDTVLIRGFLDRVDVTKDGIIKIIDYKTTKNEKYLDDFQLLVYGLWLQKEYPGVDKFKGAYVLLRHGSKLKEYDFNMHDVEKVKKKLIEYADNIRNEDSWTPIPTRLCNWCDFKDICPAQEAW
jgi:RecB family exonuclease